MHSLFTTVDTLDTSTYLHSVVQPNNSFDLQWVMPVTGLTDNGRTISPPAFDKNYGIYLTIDASGQLNTGAPPDYHSINVTLWADPKNDVGTASSTVQNGITRSGSVSNDIVLATGTLISGTMSINPSTMVRMATYVEQLTPTLDGTILLHGSIQQGDQLTEKFVTQPSEFQAGAQPDGTTVDLVNGGAATVTLSHADGSPATISIPTESLLKSALTFLYHPGGSHRDTEDFVYRGEGRSRGSANDLAHETSRRSVEEASSRPRGH